MSIKKIGTDLGCMRILWGSFLGALGLHLFFFWGICVLMPAEYYRLGSPRRARHGMLAVRNRDFKKGAGCRVALHVRGISQNVSTSVLLPHQDVSFDVVRDQGVLEELFVYLPVELQRVFQAHNIEPYQKKSVVQKDVATKKKMRKREPRKIIFGKKASVTQVKKIKKSTKLDRAKIQQNKKNIQRPVAADKVPVSLKQASGTVPAVKKNKSVVGTVLVVDGDRKDMALPVFQKTAGRCVVSESVRGVASSNVQKVAEVCASPEKNGVRVPESQSVIDVSAKGAKGVGSDLESFVQDVSVMSAGSECDLENAQDCLGQVGDDVGDAFDATGVGGEAGPIMIAGDYIEMDGSVDTTGGLASEYQQSGAAALGEFLNKNWTTPAGCRDTSPVEIDATVSYDGALIIDAIRVSSVPIKNYAAKRFLSQIPADLLKAVVGLKVKFKFL